MTLVLIALPILFVIVCIIVVSVFVSKKQNIPRLETEGILEKIRTPKGRGEDSTFYICYQVNGKAYKGMVGNLGAKGLDRHSEIGTKVTVLYNPERPEDFYCVKK